MVDVNSLAVENFHGILAFIPDDSDFTLAEAMSRLRKALPRREVVRRGNRVKIAARRWAVWLAYVDQPYVAEESREMAEWIAGHPLAGSIAVCRRRVEFEGTHTDPATRCFADLRRVCEVMKGFRGVIVFDLESHDTFE
jgi:hypothetical protein